ncbi:iron uptake porin [Moorena bouillonii]|uniref:S-layer protein n=1 Tax=Moorena bouillonii PNG TaxID=568701 RepID=A0A1U7MXP6_9CYAN|nr:iron uptake porin [Moorena bouillonii]OLT58477.1 S-layer protein [Moorena bouillonii PNG]
MSKLLLKSLLISPAVVGAALALGTNEVQAANKANSLTVESQVTTEAAPLQAVPVKTIAIALQSAPKANAAAPTAPEVKDTPVFSTEMGSSLGEGTSLTLKADTLVPKVDVPEAETKIAQAVPSASDNSQLLNQIQRYGKEGSNSQDQVTSVSQLRDVSPGDWAYEALRSLVERYGCIAGYPNRTFRGNRATTRYEFAAGLNACLNQIERLIAASTADFITREDLETLQRLIQEFEAELATLGARVDNLEGRVAFLEDHQFSTTTKLEGEVIFALTNNFGDFGEDDNNQVVFGDRVRLVLDTSFTGEDSLVTRLSAGNLNAFTAGGEITPELTQTFNTEIDGTGDGNDIGVDWLAYYGDIPIGPFGQVSTYIAAFGGRHDDYVPTLNPYFQDFDGGSGSLSTFSQQNPIYRIGGGAGLGVSFQLGLLESVIGPSTVTLGYLAGNASDPDEGAGLFNGDYSALGQLNFNVNDRIGVGFTYVHGFHKEDSAIFSKGAGENGIVGTRAANLNQDALLASRLNDSADKVTNSYGAELAFRLTDKISFSGFFNYTDVIVIGEGGGEIWSYGGGLAFPDFGKEGSVLGLFGGAVPYSDLNEIETPIHIEGFYKYQLSDNISITPGVIWVINPEQSDDNDDAVIGTIRTTFTF